MYLLRSSLISQHDCLRRRVARAKGTRKLHQSTQQRNHVVQIHIHIHFAKIAQCGMRNGTPQLKLHEPPDEEKQGVSKSKHTPSSWPPLKKTGPVVGIFQHLPRKISDRAASGPEQRPPPPPSEIILTLNLTSTLKISIYKAYKPTSSLSGGLFSRHFPKAASNEPRSKSGLSSSWNVNDVTRSLYHTKKELRVLRPDERWQSPPPTERWRAHAFRRQRLSRPASWKSQGMSLSQFRNFKKFHSNEKFDLAW